MQISEDAALLQQLEGESNSEDEEHDAASVQVMAADILFGDPKSLSPGEMETCLNEMQMAASRSHGLVYMLCYKHYLKLYKELVIFCLIQKLFDLIVVIVISLVRIIC